MCTCTCTCTCVHTEGRPCELRGVRGLVEGRTCQSARASPEPVCMRRVSPQLRPLCSLTPRVPSCPSRDARDATPTPSDDLRQVSSGVGDLKSKSLPKACVESPPISGRLCPRHDCLLAGSTVSERLRLLRFSRLRLLCHLGCGGGSVVLFRAFDSFAILAGVVEVSWMRRHDRTLGGLTTRSLEAD